jgi:hypothetical protein
MLDELADALRSPGAAVEINQNIVAGVVRKLYGLAVGGRKGRN